MTADRWRRLVRRQQRSGLSVGGFCAKHGLAVSTFFAWRRRVRADSCDRTPAFVEVTAAVDQAESSAALADRDESSGAPIELVLSCGVVVRVHQGADVATLRRVLEVLR